jgi:hypothetical protein
LSGLLKKAMTIPKKKAYKKPNVESVSIDNEISLVMMTSETDPGSGDVPKTPPLPAPPKSTKSSKFQSNPFGTTTNQ